MSDQNYLKTELYQLVAQDPSIFEFIQESSLDGLWYWDLESPENEWMNKRFWTLLGFSPEEKKHLASEWQDLIFAEDLEVALDNFYKHCEDPSHPYDQVVRYKHKDGSTIWVRCRGIAIRDKDGKPIRMLGAHNDITELKRQEEKLACKNKELAAMARRDSLTGLYNRRAFEEFLHSQLTLALREQLPVSLVILDIDHFKAINDTYGHDAGDEVLEKTASILKSAARQSDLVARIGGEEFAVILFNSNQVKALESSERYRKAVERYVWHKENITVSVGSSTFDHRYSSEDAKDIYGLAKQLIISADKAMYLSKRNGRNCSHHFYEDD